MNQSKSVLFLLGILAMVAVGVICYFLQSILKPFFVAIFLSILLEPIMRWLRGIKIPKSLALLLVLILTFSFLFLLGLLVYTSITSFADELPKYETKFVNIFQNVLTMFDMPMEELNARIKEIDWTTAIKDLSLPSIVSSGIGSFFNFLGNVFIVLLFMVYLLVGKEYMVGRIERAFEGERSQQIRDAMENINDQIQKYLITKTLISLATGLIATIILLVFGVDFAVVWGMLTFLLNYIPNIGSIIATAPPILVAFLQFDSFLRPLWITVLLLLVQMAMGNIIEPKFMGKSLDLSPLVVILFLIFWGFLWGIVGMILAVPIAATIKIVTANFPALRPVSVLMSGN